MSKEIDAEEMGLVTVDAVMEVANDNTKRGETVYTKAQVEVLVKTLFPKDITVEEIGLSLRMAEQSGANIFTREIYIMKVMGKLTPVYSKEFLKKKAFENPKFKSYHSAPFYEKDKLTIDMATGEVSHIINPIQDRGKILGAWCVAEFTDGKKIAQIADMKTYNKGKNAWSTHPAEMILKCVEAIIFRKFSCLGPAYIEEELPTEQAPRKVTRPTANDISKITQ